MEKEYEGVVFTVKFLDIVGSYVKEGEKAYLTFVYKGETVELPMNPFVNEENIEIVEEATKHYMIDYITEKELMTEEVVNAK